MQAGRVSVRGLQKVAIDVLPAERRYGLMTHAQRLDKMLRELEVNLPGYAISRLADITFQIDPVPADAAVWESVLLVLANLGLQVRVA